jgi:2-polyprenyl-3-methyl-5-hydroxy-6-metoxy-1,4-benzoquinol methylase
MRVLEENIVAERAVALNDVGPAEVGHFDATGVSEAGRYEDIAEAFDAVAAGYHDSNAANPILADMRRRVLAAIGAHVPRGARILDLGCGPGTDDELLARAGYDVTAIDWSRSMVHEAEQRIARADLRDRVRVHHLGIHQLDRLPSFAYDAAISNFGPLNCVPDLGEAARQVAVRLRHHAVLIASVIGRVCPWEIAFYTARGRFTRARVRFARGAVAVPLNGRTVWTRYYSPAEFEAIFGEHGFSRVSLHALGLFAPPPYLEGFAARHPRLVERLGGIDATVGGWPLLRRWGDHFLIVLRKA